MQTILLVTSNERGNNLFPYLEILAELDHRVEIELSLHHAQRRTTEQNYDIVLCSKVLKRMDETVALRETARELAQIRSGKACKVAVVSDVFFEHEAEFLKSEGVPFFESHRVEDIKRFCMG
ncbi:MAG: hypothetical protein Q8N81_00655 [bacterium]|nr:hypothetical protein [bacterium]